MPVEVITHELKEGLLTIKVDQPANTGERIAKVDITFKVKTLPIVYGITTTVALFYDAPGFFKHPERREITNWPQYIGIDFWRELGSKWSNMVAWLPRIIDDATVQLNDEIAQLKTQVELRAYEAESAKDLARRIEAERLEHAAFAAEVAQLKARLATVTKVVTESAPTPTPTPAPTPTPTPAPTLEAENVMLRLCLTDACAALGITWTPDAGTLLMKEPKMYETIRSLIAGAAASHRAQIAKVVVGTTSG